MYTGHLDTSGMVHECKCIAAIVSFFDIKKQDRNDPAIQL